jgi:lambda repressor-like predicted transcriptional regulator
MGALADGTPYYAPIGQVLADDAKVVCHLCGRAFRSVAAHIAFHGWTKEQYCTAFGLERSQSLEGAETRKLRATAFSARLVFEPALRTGSAAGHARARSGELARAAADAARGRPFPEQRRRRASRTMPSTARAQAAAASRERADLQLATVARDVARQRGYASIGELVLDRLSAGHSLAAVSRDCGLNKDWLNRHLPRLDPVAAERARAGSAAVLDGRWSAVVARFGFEDVAGYLRQRHHGQHMTINAIARESGLSFPTVKAALHRHGLTTAAHATKRHAARHREEQVAARLGVESISEFIELRRAEGWTWRQLAAESGQPEAWLRRRALPAR